MNLVFSLGLHSTGPFTLGPRRRRHAFVHQRDAERPESLVEVYIGVPTERRMESERSAVCRYPCRAGMSSRLAQAFAGPRIDETSGRR